MLYPLFFDYTFQKKAVKTGVCVCVCVFKYSAERDLRHFTLYYGFT